MLTLAIFSLPSCSLAIFSRCGANILQGWHHSAQKSTRTGVSASRTSAWNVPSVTATGCVIVFSLYGGGRVRHRARLERFKIRFPEDTMYNARPEVVFPGECIPRGCSV